MSTRISSTEVARNLGDCLARIKHRGERFIITKNNKPVAELGPVTAASVATLRDLWMAMREVRPDEGSAADLERVNSADAVMDDPWA